MLKEKLKNKLDYYPKFNEKKIKNIIDKYQYISFDIFDTLVKRDVKKPEDIFKIIEMNYFEKNPKGFFNDRIEAEKKARIATNTEEISIDDIYNILKENPKYTTEEIENLKAYEIEIELSMCTKSIEMYKIYQYCLEKNKTIIITTNMYLKKDTIVAILKNSGYNNYYKLYVSSDIGKKKNKTLFEYILNDLQIKSNQIVHIGDSIKNDIKGAKQYGISTIKVPKMINKLSHSELAQCNANDKFFVNTLDAFINNRIDVNKNEFYNFGYESFGILLYGFCKMLHENVKKRGINDIFFFSRDGHIIKKVYDTMYGKDDSIYSHYIYVSRRSLRVPQIWISPELSDVVKTFPLAKLLTMETFIKNLGLVPENYEELLIKNHLNLNTTIEKKEILSNKDINNFYNEIKNDVIEHSKQECDILLQYFRQEKFSGKVAVVDIGWHGSLQYFIQILTKKCNYDLDMYGYYIGLAKEAKKEIETIGYVIDLDSNTKSCDSWKAFNGLAETLFLAQEGSTEKFRKKENTIEPVLYKYEYDKANGEKEPEAKKVKLLQQGAVDFVSDFKESILNKFEFPSYIAFRKIYLTGICPNKKDLKMFSNFRFLEEQIDYLAMPKSFISYIFHPKTLKKDLFLSRWKIGFLKKLLKINIQYIKIYKILRKMSD